MHPPVSPSISDKHPYASTYSSKRDDEVFLMQDTTTVWKIFGCRLVSASKENWFFVYISTETVVLLETQIFCDGKSPWYKYNRIPFTQTFRGIRKWVQLGSEWVYANVRVMRSLYRSWKVVRLLRLGDCPKWSGFYYFTRPTNKDFQEKILDF